MKIEIEVDITRSKNGNAITRMKVGYPNYPAQYPAVFFEANKIVPKLEEIFNKLKADAIGNQDWCDKVYIERNNMQPAAEKKIVEAIRQLINEDGIPF